MNSDDSGLQGAGPDVAETKDGAEPRRFLSARAASGVKTALTEAELEAAEEEAMAWARRVNSC